MAVQGDLSAVYADILIIGATPAGLMAASCLTRCGATFRIVEKRPKCIKRGYANCLQPRTQEVLQTLGLLSTIADKAVRVRENTVYTRGSTGELLRESIGLDTLSHTCYPYSRVVDQGVVADILEEDLRSWGHIVDYSYELIDYVVKTGNIDSWHIQAYLKNHATGAIELWRAGYILGCDGEASTVRRIAGIGFEDHGVENVWAVADVAAETSFPDIKRRSVVKSVHGTCILGPSTEDRVRVITPLTPAFLASMDPSEYSTASQSLHDHRTHPTTLLTSLQTRLSAALSPWVFTIKGVSCITRYHNKKRLAFQFSDTAHRIFLLGDTCHTHSPLTNQSVNTGMMDAHNLSWKLALVLRGLASSSLLATYDTERRALAQQLIRFDVKVDQIILQQPNSSAVDEGFHDFKNGNNIISGCGVQYSPGLVVKEEVRIRIKSSHESLKPGKRLLPMTLTRHMDGNEVNVLDEMQSDERFHLFVFAGETLISPDFVSLAIYLASADSPLTVFSSPQLVDLFFIHTWNHFVVSLPDLPDPFPRWAHRVYEDPGGKAYASVGVNPKFGVLLLVRPDGHVAVVTNLDDGRGIMDFLRAFLLDNGAGSPDEGTPIGDGEDMVL
ncbi:hypothetical protein MMC17_003512 [Xylographa soralifera]|nr:hypothetical protein [Xylographa soralifera]